MTLSILTGSYLFWINNYILWFVVTIMYKRDLWSIEYKSAIIPRLIYGNLRLFCVLEIKYNRFSYIDVFRFVNALWCEGWGSWRCASRCINYFFPNVSRCITMLTPSKSEPYKPNVSRCIKYFPNVSRCITNSRGITMLTPSKSETYKPNVSRCITNSRCITMSP
jgi:hypothetical protein